MPTAMKIVKKYFPNVKKVVDATRSVKVKVTDADQKATKKDHSGCAMARAAERELHVDGAIISVGTSYLIKGNMALRYKTTPTVAREVVSFDRNAGFENGVYHLRRPGKHEKLGHDPKGKGHGPQNRPDGRKQPHHVTTNVRTWLGREGR